MTKARKTRRKEQPPPEAPPPSTIHDQIRWIALNSGVPVARVTAEHAERAAIREYLGGMPRPEAEAAAIHDTCDVFGVADLLQSLQEKSP